MCTGNRREESVEVQKTWGGGEDETWGTRRRRGSLGKGSSWLWLKSVKLFFSFGQIIF